MKGTVSNQNAKRKMIGKYLGKGCVPLCLRYPNEWYRNEDL
jgi:hypothetical protein